MKKIISVLLIVLVFASAVFATTDSEKITIKTSVDDLIPNFVLVAGLSKENYGTIGSSDDSGSFDDAVIEEGVPAINEADVVIYFKVLQKGFARYKKNVEIKFSVGDLVLTKTDNQYRVAGIISDVTAEQPLLGYFERENKKENIANSVSVIPGNDNKSVIAKYNGLVSEDQPIATFIATWQKDVLAPNGTYMASVKMEYLVN